jgi:hypothetical protein
VKIGSAHTYIHFWVEKTPFHSDMITKSADKINISDNRTAFSHSSYCETFEYAIDSEKKDSDRIRDILVKILVKLVNDNEALGDVAYTIANNYNSLPSNVQQLYYSNWQTMIKLQGN